VSRTEGNEKTMTMVLALALLGAISCKPAKTEVQSQPGAPIQESNNSPAPPPAVTANAGPASKINAARAMQYTKEVTAFGARPVGSENHRKLESYILSHLKGDEVESDTFTADTMEGKFPVRNIIAKFPGTKDGIIVIAGHYDTNIRSAILSTWARMTAARRPRFCWKSPTSFAGRTGTATASGWYGPMAKKPCALGRRPTAFTAQNIWPSVGKKTAPPKKSRRSCSPT
jgi:hypothetical protein